METANPSGDTFLDFRRVMSEWRIPSFDLEAVAQAQRKNIEALTQANQLALEGTQALMRRNLELARQSMEELQAIMSDFAKPNGSIEDRLSRQAEFSKKTIEQGMANFRDLAEMMAKANSDAMNVLAKRMTEGLEEVRGYTQKTT
jgi:phasin family protein